MAAAAQQRADRRLASIEEAQRAMPRLIAEINEQPKLARAALANPLFAIEELGWSIDESIRSTFERRVRFKPDVAARLDALEAQIAEIAGHHVEVDDQYEVARLLFDQLHLDAPAAAPKRAAKRSTYDETAPAITQDSLSTAPLPPRLPWSTPPEPDPLAVLEGRHPVIAPLLEYRQLDAGAPRLATPEAYREVRDAEGGSIGNVRFSRHQAPDKPPKKPAAKRSKGSS